MSSTRPCGSSSALQAGLVDPGDEEVLVRVRQPEQLVADGAADDVGVEAERADVGADLGRHRRLRASVYRCATASISTRAPDGSFATSKVERAGGRSPTWRAYTSFIAAKSSRSWRKTLVLTRLSSELPGLLEDGREVAERLLGLGGDVALGRRLAGLQAELAGDEDELADADRLVVRRTLERGRRLLGADHGLLHAVPPIGRARRRATHCAPSATPSALKMASST